MATALEAGTSALKQGEWTAAREAFEGALAEAETPEALEGLGLAAWWLDDVGVVFEARQRAYQLYSERDDRLGAARIATSLAWDYEAFRGESAVAGGWVQRAHSLLEGFPLAAEHGWLALRDAEIALRRDTGEARRLAAEGAAIGRELGSLDIEMTGLALDGLALVSAGEIEQGMRQLDEATTAAVGGELTDLYVIGLNCCRLIAACERVGDYERATQWCARMIEFAQRWHMRPFFAVCRTQYASVLMRRGNWSEAESALLEASATLAEARPAMALAGVVRLAELRRRQGRTEEASALFAQAEGHPLALLGRAELALDTGDRDGAEELARSFLRRVPAEDRLERAAGLELLVRVDPSSERARAAMNELRRLARHIPTPPLRAGAAFAEALAAGDPEGMEEAIDLFERAGQPFEAARARAELARLTRDERHERAAREALERLGVRRGSSGVLTRRELEVLRLVADGLSDPEIAARLVLSEHTVHRHVANIRAKLRQPSRAAAAAYATRNGLL
ncbi:MAG TPA: LuxR C-terminal-related transcriptional regulator [Gaiellaceae bacterium]|nr:LuxR C-terminal-related transcriptional regulator [Gaiellaceae bacterium]